MLMIGSLVWREHKVKDELGEPARQLGHWFSWMGLVID